MVKQLKMGDNRQRRHHLLQHDLSHPQIAIPMTQKLAHKEYEAPKTRQFPLGFSQSHISNQ